MLSDDEPTLIDVEEAFPEPEPAPEEPLPSAPLRAVIEAILFAGEEPVTVADLALVLGEERIEEIATAVRQLTHEYEQEGRGLRVQPIAGGYRISTDPALGPFIREMVRARNRQRLSRAALETLAIVAYKQPITGPEIQEIRGVSPSAILASLLDRHLIRILGRKKVVGKPFLYGTTREFLIRFGLNSLDDLPSMEEFQAMLQEEAAPAETMEPAPQSDPDEPS
ncbi:MAG TPA: SMC-Scp complex subunit ScpB [Candidatus Polarisedimenticolia bacterium]|nr:SMC-Scp complex subunit ScpB [Candidatus Polarisedimenticolia bacterium]